MAEFDDAKRVAQIQDLVRRLRGLPIDLLPFEQVRESLRLRHTVDNGIMEVPLDLIVGTLGREREFNRFFFPREESLRDRWDEVRDLAVGLYGFNAVQLYKVGDAYFVVDGHHRVSVARTLKVPAIEARVKEFVSPVPLGPEDELGEIVLRRGFADFVDATCLAPEEAAEFEVTEPNGYDRLLEHLSVHRYYMGLDQKRDISCHEALESWRTLVYRPMVDIIRKSGVMENFPGYSVTDLYLFAMDHLHFLRERYGTQQDDATDAVEALRSTAPESGWIARLREWWK